MSMNGRARQRSPSSAGGQGARPPSSSQHHSHQYRQHDRDSYDDYRYEDRDAYNDPRRRADLQRERSSGQGQSGRAGGERHDELDERDQPSPPPERGILVRALFDFKGADGAGIRFQVGDVIEILGQLESGWWDGVFNNQRGWLPSNYVVPLPEDEAAEEFARREAELFDDEWSEAGRTQDDGRSDSYDDHHRREEDERHYRQQQPQQQQPRQRGSNGHEQPRLGESPRGPSRDASEYWVPRVTATGQIFYLNTMTGETAQDLPSADTESESGSLDYSPSVDPVYSSTAQPTNGTAASVNYDKPLPSPTPSGADSFGLSRQGGSLPLGGGFGPRSKAPLAHPWVSRMTDDGSYIYYLNPVTGEKRRDPPVDPSASISVRRPQVGMDPDSRSVSSISPNEVVDLNQDILDDNSDLDVEPPPKMSASSSVSSRRVEGPLEESRRRAREIEDRLSSTEPEGIPVLALRVRTTIRGLRDALSWRADTSRTGTPEGDFALHRACRTADDKLQEAKKAVVTATRCLIVASGVLVRSQPALDDVERSSNGLPADQHAFPSQQPPGTFIASDNLRSSHRRVTTSLTRLTFSIRHFLNTTDWITTDEEVEAGVRADAEDVERVVVAFGLEAERERSSRANASGSSLTGNKPRRLEGWLDSVGIGLPVGGRNGFSTEIDVELLTRPFGIDASEPGLRAQQARAMRSIAKIETLIEDEDPSTDPLPVYSELIRKVTDLQQYVRSFDIAGAIDLDGADEPSATDSAYTALVVKANARLRDYEDALDGLHDRAGVLMSIRGYSSINDCLGVIQDIQRALVDIVPAFLGLWDVSFAQAQAVRNGAKGKIGFRRPTSAHHNRSTSRISMGSIRSTRSKGSISSRRSHLLSLRGKGGGARGLDEEVSERDQAEAAEADELRDLVDASAFAGPPSSTSQVSIPMTTPSTGGRARQGSLSALSSASSVPSSYDMGAAMEAQSSRLSGGGKAAAEALASLRSRRESDDAALADGSMRNSGKLAKFFGSTNVPPPPEPKPWYLGSDIVEGDLVMVEGEKDQVRGGTLPALVVKLTVHDGDYSGHSFRETFLMTHKSFATPQELLSLLRDRFYLEAPPGLSDEDQLRWTKEKQLPIRLKVLNAIKIWISDEHMEAGEETVAQIEQFANSLPDALKAREGLPLIRAVQARKASNDGASALRKLTLTQLNSPPNSIVPPTSRLKTLKLTDLDPLELARQLTLMDAAMYNRIKPVECLQKAWSDLSDPNKAANIKAVIKHSNQVSNWVKVAILHESKSPKSRASIIKFFIQTAERCLALHNFSTVAAIVAGLESSLIIRLKRTFELLSPKTQAAFQIVSKAVDPDKNFTAYRDQLARLNPPSVPFLGVYLTFLTFIEDGNPNFLSGERKLINFGKRMKSAGVLREMQTYQSVPYNLSPVPAIQAYVDRQLSEGAGRTEDELYLRSLELEPREQEPERITRMLEESGFM